MHLPRLNDPPASLLLLQVVVTAMLWGAGTAVGEIPPYFLSYKAAAAGRRNEMYEGLQEALQTTTGVCKHGQAVASRNGSTHLTCILFQ